MQFLLITLFIIASFSLSRFAIAEDCIEVLKNTKIKNINTGELSSAIKGEVLAKITKYKRFYRLSLKDNSYLLHKSKTSTASCPELVGQCLITKKDVKLRNSVFKNHRKIPISSNTLLKIISVLPRKSKNYYRLYHSDSEFLWISEKQKNRLFSSARSCDAQITIPQATNNSGDEYVDRLEDYMSKSGSLNDQVKDDINETDSAPQKKSSFYLHFGYGLGLDASFLDSFIDNISDPSNVKSDPDPIITGTEGKTALFAEVHYRRSIFTPQTFLDLGFGYRLENYLLTGKDNPASASSVIRLRDLADREIKIDLSIIQISSGLFYKMRLFKTIDLYAGLIASLNYNLTDEIKIDRRIGPNKLTEEPSILNLSVIGASINPEIQIVTNMGLALHLRYNYSLEYGGFPALALGYSF